MAPKKDVGTRKVKHKLVGLLFTMTIWLGLLAKNAHPRQRRALAALDQCLKQLLSQVEALYDDASSTIEVKRRPVRRPCPRRVLPEGRAATLPVPLPLKGLALLVVDNDESNRTSLATLLKLHGARITAVDSARKALKAIARKLPDVLVCDISMPEEDGYSLIRKIRMLECPARHIPAVALTGCTLAEDRERALAEGFQVHLAKPVELSHMLQVVQRLGQRAP